MGFHQGKGVGFDPGFQGSRFRPDIHESRVDLRDFTGIERDGSVKIHYFERFWNKYQKNDEFVPKIADLGPEMTKLRTKISKLSLDGSHYPADFANLR